VPLLVLVLASLTAGVLGAYVISRERFHALATGGTPGFAAERRDAARAWLAHFHHRTTAAWLALGAAAAVFVAGWLSLGLLAYFVRGSSTVVRIDTGVARWGDRHATLFSDDVVGLVTLLGNTYVVVALALVLAVVDSVRRRNARVVLFVVTVVAGDGLITLAVKNLIDRARPTFNPIAYSLGPSFPSGHTSMAAGFYAAAALLLSRGHSPRAAAALGGSAVGIAVAVAASRVFLDVHWLSDVVAGLGLGWAWFAFCAIAFGSIPRRARRRAEAAAVESVASA
jgi:membrane-associated phospholipid phosphatase